MECSKAALLVTLSMSRLAVQTAPLMPTPLGWQERS
jgi:hypothetical protein